MAKIEQALILDPPSELHFKAPFTDVTTSYLYLKNPTEKHICFKVKTTAPKTYCVRPNSGVVNPRETVTIAVMLQPLDLETTDKSKHKFMVQSMFVNDGDVNQENLWREAPVEGLMNSKLKCVFDLPPSENIQTLDNDDLPKEEPKLVPTIAPETTKSSPKTTANAELEIRKAFEDNKKLKIEVNELRQENSSLKEEGLRWRVASDTKPRTAASKSLQPNSQPRHFLLESNYLIVLCFFIFFFGLYLGKNAL